MVITNSEAWDYHLPTGKGPCGVLVGPFFYFLNDIPVNPRLV